MDATALLVRRHQEFYPLLLLHHQCKCQTVSGKSFTPHRVPERVSGTAGGSQSTLCWSFWVSMRMNKQLLHNTIWTNLTRIIDHKQPDANDYTHSKEAKLVYDDINQDRGSF